MHLRRLGLLVLAGSLAACSPAPAPSTTTVPSGYVDLVTLSGIPPSTPPGVMIACGGVGFTDSALRGSSTDLDHAWLETVAQPSLPSHRVSVRWPSGFRARFVPTLELVDWKGAVVAEEGDLLREISGQLDADGRWDIWEFNGHSFGCY